jgi:hypothetical protein
MGGFYTLNPRNFQWISGDNTSGYIAQLFFLSDKWRFPLAANPNFGLDLSTSLNYSGPPVPLMLIQKLLGINPSLQFIGFWLLSMMILQVFFGMCIGTSLGLKTLQSIFFGLLFITPFFLYRFQFHFWLTAHFLILWAFWIVIKSIQTAKLLTKEVVLLIIVAYSINIYLLAMCLIIISYPIAHHSLNKNILFTDARKHCLTVACTLLISYLILEFKSQRATFMESFRMNFTGEYTLYPSNVLSVFNAEVGYSRDCSAGHCIFGDQRPPEYVVSNFSILDFDLGGVQGNFEGFLYLGIGLIVLIFFTTGMALAKARPRQISQVVRKHFLAIIYLTSIALFAITYRVSIGNVELQHSDFKLIRWALSPFRASSRFMWIIAYFLVILAVYTLVKKTKPRVTTLFLVMVLLLQTIDMAPKLGERFEKLDYSSVQAIPLHSNFSGAFEKISRDKKRMVIFPSTSQVGMPTVAYESWRNGLVSGMVQSSRINYALAERLDMDLRKRICTGLVPTSWIVAIPSEHYELFSNCQSNLTVKTSFSGLIFLERKSKEK